MEAVPDDGKQFRVIEQRPFRSARPDCPRTIPWGLVEPHRPRALANHGHALERLDDQGGLSLEELWFLFRDLPWGSGGVPDKAAALDDLLARVEAYRSPRGPRGAGG